MLYYPAILTSVEDGLTVTFPDFPGCISFGQSLDVAAAQAEAALALHIAGMIEDGDALPTPSALDAVPADPDEIEAGRLLVRAQVTP
ncbi:hypothetical protein CHT98_32930 (plasmid) [Azospirillum brasilense]|uniref:HicB-like antitoxin of toxin-antitoxin system domain-containing protein n=1 Tax=Azospirillum brasilense TaxID=192 RepID=A0A235H2P7_AZOBR|nr:hypothetical protein CHT98_32930 [Azospirillum brasilense]